MPSLSKSESARLNGAKSKGPKTESGRARSSQNALKHGLTSQTLVLPSEDPAGFDALLASYLQQLSPIGPVEQDLVHEMVAAKWRLDRIARIETQLFTEAIDHVEEYSDDPLSPGQALAGAFERLANRGSLDVLHRMESRFARAYSRALRNLLQLQRLRRPPTQPTTPPEPETQICKNEPNPTVNATTDPDGPAQPAQTTYDPKMHPNDANGRSNDVEIEEPVAHAPVRAAFTLI